MFGTCCLVAVPLPIKEAQWGRNIVLRGVIWLGTSTQRSGKGASTGPGRSGPSPPCPCGDEMAPTPCRLRDWAASRGLCASDEARRGAVDLSSHMEVSGTSWTMYQAPILHAIWKALPAYTET